MVIEAVYIGQEADVLDRFLCLILTGFCTR